MAKQSNSFQRMMKNIYEFAESSGATVTESALVPDVHGNEREVDILIETEVCGEVVRMAVECRAHKRKCDNTWIDSLAGKYSDLPSVHKVIAVSESGFFDSVAARAAAKGIAARTLDDVLDTDWPAQFRQIGMVNIQRTDRVRPLQFVLGEHPPDTSATALGINPFSDGIPAETKLRVGAGWEGTLVEFSSRLYEKVLKEKLSDFLALPVFSWPETT